MRRCVRIVCAVSSLLATGTAHAYCGRDVSGRPGAGTKTNCPISNADLHFQFDEASYGTTDPWNDEPAGAPGFLISAGTTAGMVDGTEPLTLSGIFGRAAGFDGITARKVRVQENTTTVLDAPTTTAQIGVSFWVRPRPGSHTIVYKGNAAGARNYEVRMNADHTFSFLYTQENAALVECKTSQLSGAAPWRENVWQQVTLAIDQPGGTNSRFRYRYNGGTECNVKTSDGAVCLCGPCTACTNAIAGSGMTANNDDLLVGTGAGAAGTFNADADLDELRVVVGAVPSQHGNGGVTIQQVVFGDSTPRNDRVWLYRSFLAAGSELNDEVALTNWSLTDSQLGGGNVYAFPTSVALKPGEWAQVTLCNASDPTNCPADQILAAGSPDTCNRLFTLNDGNVFNTLGDGQTSTAEVDCNTADCLTANDAISLGVTAAKAGLSWGNHGVTGDPNFNNGTNGLGVNGRWPVPTVGGVETTLDPTGAIGFRLTTQGNDANSIDAWSKILPSQTYPLCSSSSGATTGATGHLGDFRAAGADHAARVSWTTLDELDVASFTVFRSLSGAGGPFEEAADVPASGALNGSAYEIVDDGLENGAHVWYGLELRGAQGDLLDSHVPIEVTIGAAPGSGSGWGCAVTPARPSRPAAPVLLATFAALAVVLRRRAA